MRAATASARPASRRTLLNWSENGPYSDGANAGTPDSVSPAPDQAARTACSSVSIGPTNVRAERAPTWFWSVAVQPYPRAARYAANASSAAGAEPSQASADQRRG